MRVLRKYVHSQKCPSGQITIQKPEIVNSRGLQHVRGRFWTFCLSQNCPPHPSTPGEHIVGDGGRHPEVRERQRDFEGLALQGLAVCHEEHVPVLADTARETKVEGKATKPV